MLRLIPVGADSPALPRIAALYGSAFPRGERQPLARLLDRGVPGAELLALYDGERFVGFASLLTLRDITHILYFAVDDALRGHGYGSEALALLHAHRPGNRFLADVEVERAGACNNGQREKRIAFYLRNGYAVSPVHYRWRGESYEILVHGGALTEEEFDAFWAYFDQTTGGAIV